MSFLDILLTLESQLSEGSPVISYPRTLRSFLTWNNQPSTYQAHQTQAGLYIVLPHRHDGKLCLTSPKKEFAKVVKWPSEKHHIGGAFFLHETFEKSDGRSLVLGSTVSKTMYHSGTRTGILFQCHTALLIGVRRSIFALAIR